MLVGLATENRRKKNKYNLTDENWLHAWTDSAKRLSGPKLNTQMPRQKRAEASFLSCAGITIIFSFFLLFSVWCEISESHVLHNVQFACDSITHTCYEMRTKRCREVVKRKVNNLLWQFRISGTHCPLCCWTYSTAASGNHRFSCTASPWPAGNSGQQY